MAQFDEVTTEVKQASDELSKALSEGFAEGLLALIEKARANLKQTVSDYNDANASISQLPVPDTVESGRAREEAPATTIEISGPKT